MNFNHIILIAALSTPILPVGHQINLMKGMSFLQARKVLLASHWQPIYIHKGDDYDYVGVESEFKEKKFPELMFCTVDTSNCALFYKNNNQCLKLETIGEHISFMEIVRWSHECPQIKKQN